MSPNQCGPLFWQTRCALGREYSGCEPKVAHVVNGGCPFWLACGFAMARILVAQIQQTGADCLSAIIPRRMWTGWWCGRGKVSAKSGPNQFFATGDLTSFSLCLYVKACGYYTHNRPIEQLQIHCRDVWSRLLVQHSVVITAVPQWTCTQQLYYVKNTGVIQPVGLCAEQPGTFTLCCSKHTALAVYSSGVVSGKVIVNTEVKLQPVR